MFVHGLNIKVMHNKYSDVAACPHPSGGGARGGEAARRGAGGPGSRCPPARRSPPRAARALSTNPDQHTQRHNFILLATFKNNPEQLTNYK